MSEVARQVTTRGEVPDAPRMDASVSGPPPSARGVLRSIAVARAATDVAVCVGAVSLTQVVRPGAGHGTGGPAMILLAAGLWLIVFFAFGLEASRSVPAWDEFRRIIAATTVGVIVLVAATLWWRPIASGSALMTLWVAALVLELCVRRAWRWIVWRLRERGVLVLRTLIVGTGDEAASLADSLARTSTGFAPIGHVAIDDGVPTSGIEPLASLSALSRLLHDRSVDCVYVASANIPNDALFQVSRACRRANVEMRVAANLPRILPSRMCIDGMGDVIAISISPGRLTRFQSALKRVFDVMLSSVALIVLSPIMGAVALAILISSGRPVLFCQQRVTRDFATFCAYKFRTMVPDADSSENIRHLQLATPFFKLQDDPRITPVGRFLRRFSLDELPQLWNVLRGEMTLVGPRPLRVEQVSENEQMLGTRHEVKAGLTGWWQIRGRSDVSWVEAVEMDTFYIENWSLALDTYILLKTVPVLLRARGAY